MANHVIRKSAFTNVLPSCLGELRQHVLAPVLGNPLFSEAEQSRANHFVHESEDVARREAAAAHQRGQATLQVTLHRLCPGSFRGYRPRQLQPALTWAPGIPLPDRADRRAGTFDRRVVARVAPGQSLTLANLLTRPRR